MNHAPRKTDGLLADFLERSLGDLPFSLIVTSYVPEDPRTVYVNEAFSRMTGYATCEFLGKNPKLLQGPKTDRAVLDRLQECLLTGETFVGQTWNYRKDGTPFLVQWTIFELEFVGRKYYAAIQRDATHLGGKNPNLTAEIALLAQQFDEAFRSLLNILDGLTVALSKGSEPEESVLRAMEISAVGQMLRSLAELQRRVLESTCGATAQPADV
jgi:PAS domain S-box-containing protein